ncbi:MAG: 4'-phosphopantetheinyl transferase superfamily protein [Alistipes sp.]
MNNKLIIEPIYSLCEVQNLVPERDWLLSQAFGSEQRRREFLSWRAVVYRELGAVELAYNAVGAPVVEHSNVYIGVSHCRGRVAVCISDKPCAVDIEQTKRNFRRVASRYISEQEQTLSDDPLLPAVVWCAKECLYKYAGLAGLDFLRDIRVTQLDLKSGTITGCIKNGEAVSLFLRVIDEYVVVYVL